MEVPPPLLLALDRAALTVAPNGFDEILTGPDLAAVDTRRSQRRVRSAAQTARILLGELLITCALVTGLYLVWLVWWTDVKGEEAQDDLVASLEWVAPALDVEPDQRPVKHTDDAPAIAEPADAETFAVMYVPRWGFDYARPVSQGVDRPTVLDPKGIGHYPGTAMPGQVGNFAVAAHRTTYGKPFNRVEELQIGDPMVIQTEDAWYVYRVTGTEVVRPQDVDVIAAVPGDPDATATEQTITMTTCHPMFSARERFVVHGELDYWWPAESGTPDELTGQEA